MSQPKLARSNSLNQANMAQMIADLKEVKCSNHWLRKMKTIFNVHDPERTGWLSIERMENDFGKRVTEVFNLTPEQEAEYRQINKEWLDDVFQKVEGMTFDTFYKTQYLIMTIPEMREAQAQLADENIAKQFKIVDMNRDGVISREEWRSYFRCLGVEDEKLANEAFDVVDLNKDGVISLKEFIEGHKDFLFNEEPSKYDLFYGPLAEL